MQVASEKCSYAGDNGGDHGVSRRLYRLGVLDKQYGVVAPTHTLTQSIVLHDSFIACVCRFCWHFLRHFVSQTMAFPHTHIHSHNCICVRSAFTPSFPSFKGIFSFVVTYSPAPSPEVPPRLPQLHGPLLFFQLFC